jgi:hypothetical protein
MAWLSFERKFRGISTANVNFEALRPNGSGVSSKLEMLAC